MNKWRRSGWLLGQALWVLAWWPFVSLLRSKMAAVPTALVPGSIRRAQSNLHVQRFLLSLSGCPWVTCTVVLYRQNALLTTKLVWLWATCSLTCPHSGFWTSDTKAQEWGGRKRGPPPLLKTGSKCVIPTSGHILHPRYFKLYLETNSFSRFQSTAEKQCLP